MEGNGRGASRFPDPALPPIMTSRLLPDPDASTKESSLSPRKLHSE